MPSDAASPEEIKTKQTRHWDDVAAGWSAWYDWSQRNFQPVTEWMRSAAAIQSGARVLDVACGPGYPALGWAAAVQPGGSVVAIDLSPGMIARASQRARSYNLDNIAFAAMDAEQLQIGDDIFDAVTNAYGLMFCPDPARAIREARRVLTPGGALVIAVWDEPAKNPFFSIVGSGRSLLSLPAVAPGDPGPFRFAPAGALESVLAASGFSEFRVESVEATFECASIDEYIQMFTDVALKNRIASLPEPDADRFRDAVRDSARPFIQDGRLRLLATSRCARATKTIAR
jgi:SAM-dependent methyltransferase